MIYEFNFDQADYENEQSFLVGNEMIDVRWRSVDPEVNNWPKRYHDTGVLFIAADDNNEAQVHITNKISVELQGYAALHEKLCMIDCIASCTDIEIGIVNSISNEDSRRQYIEFRKDMFALLVEDNPDDMVFKSTLNYLQSL